MDLEKEPKTQFLDSHLVCFWVRLSMNSSVIAKFVGKLVDVLISFVI